MPIEGQNLSALMVQGFIPLDIFSAKVFTSSAGAVLSSASTPLIEVISTGALSSANPIVGTVASGGAAATFIFPPVGTPPDWSTQDGMTVHLTGRRATSSDTTKTYGIQVQAIDPTNGLTMSSGQTGAFASSGAFHVTCTISSGSTPALNSAMWVSVTTSTSQDPLLIGAMWITYGRKRRG